MNGHAKRQIDNEPLAGRYEGDTTPPQILASLEALFPGAASDLRYIAIDLDYLAGRVSQEIGIRARTHYGVQTGGREGVWIGGQDVRRALSDEFLAVIASAVDQYFKSV